MDILIMPSRPATADEPSGGPVITHLFDKRRQAAFAAIPLVRLPHITSMLSSNCKYDILRSQFVRYGRIIMAISNFLDEVALLMTEMVHKGYGRASCCASA
ncbi:hypothetical protein WJX72_011274 [[Myrmecia] bisecta]|uniref:Uncharacterized protein n=1 Tax=[Myrmecia] bisecta TaxID=41462 RepID=A0AAW1PDF7_9CHLO